MGSGSISKYLHWSEEDLREHERVRAAQEVALSFATKTLFYGVPVRSRRQSSAPVTAIWVEPVPEAIEASLIAKACGQQDALEKIPSGVLIDTKCNIKVLFTLQCVEFVIPGDALRWIDPRNALSASPYPPPAPPTLLARSSSHLSLSFTKALPLPLGIVDSAELQYLAVKRKKTERVREDQCTNQCSEEEQGIIKDDEVEEEKDEHLSPWKVLCVKYCSEQVFFKHEMRPIVPGRCFRFRLRYHTALQGWSDFSRSSPVYSTVCTAPSVPAPPVCSAITCYAVELHWSAPQHDHGSPIREYTLIGKSAGDDEFHVLYRGSDRHFLALGLFPEYAYSFQVAARNGVGESAFSASASIVTPPNFLGARFAEARAFRDQRGLTEEQVNAAMRCRDAWSEFWDPKTERAFYFNSILSLRQLEVPEILLCGNDASVNEEDEENSERRTHTSSTQKDSLTVAGATSATALESDKGFRTKRYRLVRALHQRKNALFTSSAGSRPAVLTLTLRRTHIVEDFFVQTKGLDREEALRRFKIVFAGEPAIDSGGLSKEAFLLLSREIAAFAVHSDCQWMRFTASLSPKDHSTDAGEGLFFSDRGQSSTKLRSMNGQRSVKKSVLSVNDKQERIKSEDEEPVIITQEQFGRMLGLLLGKALLDRQLLDFPLSSVFVRHLLNLYERHKTLVNRTLPGNSMSSSSSSLRAQKNTTVDLEELLTDLDVIDHEFSQSLRWMLANDITGVIDATFSVSTVTKKVVPLCANGDAIDVTENNKFEYVRLMALWKLIYGVSVLLQPCLEVFQSIVPAHCLHEARISTAEMNLMINGKQSVNVEELRAYCIYQGTPFFNDNHESVVWLWRAVREFDQDDRRLLLKFFTGSSRMPLDGYDPPLCITEGESLKKDNFPKAHTCFNQLVLPLFSSYEVCKERLLFAIHNTEGYAFA